MQFCSSCHEETYPVEQRIDMSPGHVYLSTVSSCCRVELETEREHASWLADQAEREEIERWDREHGN